MFRNVYINATIHKILDPCIIYPCCLVCYKKLSPENGVRWYCPTCKESYSEEELRFRYRLMFCASDGNSVHKVTAFGKYLDPIFGTNATDFKRYLDSIDRNQEVIRSISSTVLLKEAITELLVGTVFIMGFHIPCESKLAKKISNLNRQGLKHWQPGLSEIAEAVSSTYDKSGNVEQNLLAYQLFRAHSNLSSVHTLLEKKLKQFGAVDSSLEPSHSGQTPNWTLVPSSNSTVSNSQGMDSVYAEVSVLLSCEERQKRSHSLQPVVRCSSSANISNISINDIASSTNGDPSVTSNKNQTEVISATQEITTENSQVNETDHSTEINVNKEQTPPLSPNTSDVDNDISSCFFNTWGNETVLKLNSSNIYNKLGENEQFIEMPSSENIDSVLQNNSSICKFMKEDFEYVPESESVNCVNIVKDNTLIKRDDSLELYTFLKDANEDKVINFSVSDDSLEDRGFSESFFSNERKSIEFELHCENSQANISEKKIQSGECAFNNSSKSNNKVDCVSGQLRSSPHQICKIKSSVNEQTCCHQFSSLLYQNMIFPSEINQNNSFSFDKFEMQCSEPLQNEKSVLKKISEELFSPQNENSYLQCNGNSLINSNPIPSPYFIKEVSSKIRTNKRRSSLHHMSFRNVINCSPELLNGDSTLYEISGTPSLSSIVGRSLKRSVHSNIQNKNSQNSGVFSPLLFSCSSPLPCLSQSLFSSKSFSDLESPIHMNFKRDRLHNIVRSNSCHRLDRKIDFRKRQSMSNKVLSPICDSVPMNSQDMFQSPSDVTLVSSLAMKQGETSKQYSTSKNSIKSTTSFLNSVNQSLIDSSVDLFENSNVTYNNTLLANGGTPRNSHLTFSKDNNNSWQSPDLF